MGRPSVLPSYNEIQDLYLVKQILALCWNHLLGVSVLTPGQVIPKNQPKPLAFGGMHKVLSMELEQSSSPKPVLVLEWM